MAAIDPDQEKLDELMQRAIKTIARVSSDSSDSAQTTVLGCLVLAAALMELTNVMAVIGMDLARIVSAQRD